MLDNVWYVITHKDSDEKRTRNLKFTCEYIKSLGINVLVIEQDSESRVDMLCNSIGVKHVFIKNSGLFNRSWGFNCLRNFVSAEKVFLADNDIIIDKEILYDTIKLLDYYDVVRPFDGTVLYYDEESTQKFISTKQKIMDRAFSLVNIYNLSGGLCSFRVDSFYNKIGGFDERFEGWGGEDDEMHKRLSDIGASTFSFNYPGIHLNHDRKHNEGNWQPNYNKNVTYINDNNRNYNINIGDVHRYE